MAATGDYIRKLNFSSEIASLGTPSKQPEVAPAVKVDDTAPESELLPTLPSSDGKAVMITFLRHCGCPFAEKTFETFRRFSDHHPDTRFIAVSHSNKEDTDEWLLEVGGTGDVEIVVDPDREAYAKWGLGFGSYWQNVGPVSLWKAFKLGQSDKIYNRPTKSGYRWQTAGSFAVDEHGVVKWTHTSQDAGDLPKFEDGLTAVGKNATEDDLGVKKKMTVK